MHPKVDLPGSFTRYSAAQRLNDFNQSVHTLEGFKEFRDGIHFQNVCCK